MDPVTLGAIAIGTAVAGASTSAVAAIQQNRAVKKTQEATRRANAVEQRQIRAQAEQVRRERERESARVRGLLRVRGAAAGTGDGSSFEDLILAEDTALTEDLFTIDQNLVNLLARSRSGLDVDLSELASRRRNAVLDSIGGGIQGGQAGLQIGMGIREIGR